MEGATAEGGIPQAPVEPSATAPPEIVVPPSGSGGPSPTKAKPPAQPEDPEWDLGDGRKIKRSQLLDRAKNMEKGFYAQAEKLSKLEKRLAFLKDRGLDAQAEDVETQIERLAEQRMEQRLREAQMAPEDLERHKKDADLAEREKRLKAFEEQQQAHHHEQKVQAAIGEMAGPFEKAIEEHGLPKDAFAVRRLAQMLFAAHQNGTPISISDAAVRVKALYDQEWQGQFAPIQKDGAALAKRLGPEALEALRQYLVSETRAQTPKPVAQSGSPRPARQPSGPIGWEEYSALRERAMNQQR